MNIININSSIEIIYSQKSFIEEVLLCGDDHPVMEEDSFHSLSKKIPIFLLNENSMHKNDLKNEYRYEQNSDTKPQTEWLGFYARDSSGLFEHTPSIAICPERIASCVNNDEEFMFLLAKVIVHEFAHAKMDCKDQNVKYRKKDEFWHWVEESSANRYTLQVFENFTQRYHHSNSTPFRNKSWEQNLFDFIVNFVKRQPPEYALGYELFNKRPVLNWEWEREKSDLGGQRRAEEKKSWLDYMKNNYSNIDEKKAEFLFDSVFSGEKEAMEKEAEKKKERRKRAYKKVGSFADWLDI